jgi:hypothetical protein
MVSYELFHATIDSVSRLFRPTIKLDCQDQNANSVSNVQTILARSTRDELTRGKGSWLFLFGTLSCQH